MYQQGSNWMDFRKILRGDLYEHLSRNSIFVYNRTQILSTLYENLSTFIVAGYINSPKRYCCSSLNNFIFLTVKCSSTIRRMYCRVSIVTAVNQSRHNIKLLRHNLTCLVFRLFLSCGLHVRVLSIYIRESRFCKSIFFILQSNF